MNSTTAPATEARQRLYIAWTLLFVLAFIWGSSFSLIKIGLSVFTPVQVASLRVLSAGSVMMWVALPAFRHIPRKKWLYAFLSGMLGVFIPAFLFAYAQTKLNSAVAGILNALTPIFTLLIAVAFFQQKAHTMKWIGMALGFIGSVLLTLASGTNGKFELTIYPFLIILATVCYGLNGNMAKAVMQGISPIYLTSMSLTFLLPFALVVLLNSGLPAQWNLPASTKMVYASWFGITLEARWFALGCLVFLGMSSTALAMLIFNKLMQMTSAIFASAVTYLIPLVAMGWAMLDGIYLTGTQLLCMLLIIGGVYLANRKS